MDLAIPLLFALLLLAVIALLVRQRRDHQRLLDELPTGLCVIGSDSRVLRWNGQMARLSGVEPRVAVGRHVAALPSPWSRALEEALDSRTGNVTKQMLGSGDEGVSWVLLHCGRPSSAGQRQILVEDISDYQRLQDELLHKERLASIGRLAAGIAHEIGNPVTGIACVAQNLADSADAAELEQGTSEILKQTDRISRTVSSLMQLSHPGSAERDTELVPCNLADCVDEAIHLLQLDAEVEADVFENTCDRELLVRGDDQLLLQVFLNLLDNARSAAAGEGKVSISAYPSQDLVTVHVDNPGDPIDGDTLAQVFEPFFTTKDVGQGTGLGLPMVRSTLEDMNGRITLQSPIPGGIGRGTRAMLTLQPAEYDASYTDAS